MLKIEDIRKKHPTQEKTVTIKAWGGDVRIRQLTIGERAEVMGMMMSGDGKVVGKKIHTNAGQYAKSRILAASFALVEPSISYDELSALPDAMDAVNEINEALNEFDAPKK